MSMEHTHRSDGINPQLTTGESQDSDESSSNKVVIPDECGDSLWDEVLAQHPDLTTIISTAIVKESDQDISVSESGTTKS